MRNQTLKQTVLLAVILCLVFFGKLGNLYADTYSDGKITIKHEELPVKRDGQRILEFNHPYELTGNVISNVLSYIYYEEKGLLKKKGMLRVFQDDEIRKLTPLIVQAFSVATPTQVVTLSSYSERVILTDQHNYCILFITDNTLNIAFSRVHMFQNYNDFMSDKKKHTKVKENPASVSHSRFWKLVPSAGQRFEPNHQNWLVIDLSNEMYQRSMVQRVGTVDEKIRMGDSNLDARLRKLEERMGDIDGHNQSESTALARGIRSESKIKNKLSILRELVDEGIVSEEDYDYKKAKLLRESMDGMSIREQLREIKDLRSEDLITENDYNEKKKELLDQF